MVEGHTVNTERRKIEFFFNRKSNDFNFYGIFGFEHKATEAGRKLSRTFHINPVDNQSDDDEKQVTQTDLVNIGSGKVFFNDLIQKIT